MKLVHFRIKQEQGTGINEIIMQNEQPKTTRATFTYFLKDKTRATVNFLMCSVISPMVLKYKVQ
jgi:hypothetical protein